MREFMAWPDHLLYGLPDGVSDAGGAVLEPLGVAIHALDLGHVRLGAAAAVIGCGPIGLLLTQVLRAAGPAGRRVRPAAAPAGRRHPLRRGRRP